MNLLSYFKLNLASEALVRYRARTRDREHLRILVVISCYFYSSSHLIIYMLISHVLCNLCLIYYSLT